MTLTDTLTAGFSRDTLTRPAEPHDNPSTVRDRTLTHTLTTLTPPHPHVSPPLSIEGETGVRRAPKRKDTAGMTTPQPIKAREAVRLLEHVAPCTGRRVITTRDAAGRVVTVCRGCGARVWHDAALRLQPRAPRPAPPTAYVCREHWRPVSWKGTGCPDCRREAELRRALRDQREREARDTYR